MEIKIHDHKKSLVIQIFGNLDIYTSVELKAIFDKINIDTQQPIILELSNLTYMDSSGMGTLIKITNIVQEKKAEFFLSGVKPAIQKIIKVAGLAGYFNILSDDEYDSKIT